MPPEYTGKFAYQINWNGEVFKTSRTQVAWPEYNIYCRNGAPDCWTTAQELGGYGNVHVFFQRFYDAYSADTLDTYFDYHKIEFLQAFPDIEQYKPGAVDSLADGHFNVYASSTDSSIVVIRDTTTGARATLSNLVFAITRNQ